MQRGALASFMMRLGRHFVNAGRIDPKTKQRAAKTLAGMGISVSDSVRMLLVVDLLATA